MEEHDWNKVVALNPRGRAEIYSSDGKGSPLKMFSGVIATIQVTPDDVVEIKFQDGKSFIFPNMFPPFEVELFKGERRVRFATAYHKEVNGRPELGFAPNYLYL